MGSLIFFGLDFFEFFVDTYHPKFNSERRFKAMVFPSGRLSSTFSHSGFDQSSASCLASTFGGENGSERNDS